MKIDVGTFLDLCLVNQTRNFLFPIQIFTKNVKQNYYLLKFSCFFSLAETYQIAINNVPSQNFVLETVIENLEV